VIRLPKRIVSSQDPYKPQLPLTAFKFTPAPAATYIPPPLLFPPVFTLRRRRRRRRTMASKSQAELSVGPLSTPVPPVLSVPPSPKPKPYPFWLGGVAASIAASITHPLDLTKVRLQASGDKGMIQSLRKTVRTAGARGLFDGISGTLMRQMSYSLCRFWAYDESKKMLGAGGLCRVHACMQFVMMH
jgi:Mitochondrial carrier protein